MMTDNTETVEDQWNDLTETALAQVVAANNYLFFLMMGSTVVSHAEEDDDEDTRSFRTEPRSSRREFKHGEALSCINRDYLRSPQA